MGWFSFVMMLVSLLQSLRRRIRTESFTTCLFFPLTMMILLLFNSSEIPSFKLRVMHVGATERDEKLENPYPPSMVEKISTTVDNKVIAMTIAPLIDPNEVNFKHLSSQEVNSGIKPSSRVLKFQMGGMLIVELQEDFLVSILQVGMVKQYSFGVKIQVLDSGRCSDPKENLAELTRSDQDPKQQSYTTILTQGFWSYSIFDRCSLLSTNQLKVTTVVIQRAWLYSTK